MQNCLTKFLVFKYLHNSRLSDAHFLHSIKTKRHRSTKSIYKDYYALCYFFAVMQAKNVSFRHFLLYKKLKLKISTRKISARCLSLVFGLCAINHCIRLTVGVLKAWLPAMFEGSKIPCSKNKKSFIYFSQISFSLGSKFSPFVNVDIY